MPVDRKPTDLLLVSDLDGTLLEEDTYGFEEAVPVLRFLAKAKIPLVLASSKTRKEICILQESLEVQGPFICENGSAIVLPKEFPKPVSSCVAMKDDRWVLELGPRVSEIRDKMVSMAFQARVRVRNLLDMTIDEVVQVTGLPADVAALAREREYTLPFLLEGELSGFDHFKYLARQENLRVVQGGKLNHLTGSVDKGSAFEHLMVYCQDLGTYGFRVALGDAENDLGLLARADLPIVIPTSKGWNPQLVALPGVRLATRGAPGGWADEIQKILHECEIGPVTI